MKTSTLSFGLIVAATACTFHPPGVSSEEQELSRTTGYDTTTYDVTTKVDMTAASLTPGPAYDALQTATQLREDPAGLIFDLLDAAGVPLVDELRDALPSYLEDELEGWINDALVTAGIAGELDWILARSQTVLTSVEVPSTMSMPAPDAGGYAVAHHEVAGVIDVPVDSWTESHRYGQEIVFGEQSFGVAYGEMAWDALQEEMIDRTGLDIRGQLAAVADCPAVAASVADQCVWGYCVDHEAELNAICEQGLDIAVEKLHEQFAANRFDAVILHSGACTATSTGMRDGVWDAEVDFGQGLRKTPATFTATK